MAIIDHSDGDWTLSEKANSDRARHNKKIDIAIRHAAKGIIAEENIITEKGNRKVKIPVRGLKDFRFIYGRNRNSRTGGIGQGDTKPGETIFEKDKDPQGGQGGGDAPRDIIEVEVDLDYLLEIMFEELGLPYLEEKEKIQKYVPYGYKYQSISKAGPWAHLHKKKSYHEALRRYGSAIRTVIEETNCDPEDAAKALFQAQYEVEEAVLIIKENKLDHSLEPTAIPIGVDDFRFRQIEDAYVPQSQAVVIFICDSSFSMTQDKKYLMRGLFFWLAEFIRSRYEHVEIRFIIHHTIAKLVNEETFFRPGESGGTQPYTAFDLCDYIIDTEYPPNEWNIYVSYVGDGESFTPEEDVVSINKFLPKINMFSYFETPGTGWRYITESLISLFQKEFDLEKDQKTNKDFYKNEEKRFFAGIINSKEDIWPSLRFILFGKRGPAKTRPKPPTKI